MHVLHPAASSCSRALLPLCQGSTRSEFDTISTSLTAVKSSDKGIKCISVGTKKHRDAHAHAGTASCKLKTMIPIDKLPVTPPNVQTSDPI